jgi:hypothetical protein
LQGQFTKEGTTAAQFLKLGVGARAMSMGAAYVALTDDGTAHYWNPAGLAAFQNVGATLMHHDWVLDIRQEYFSLAIPAGSVGVLGLSVNVLSMDEKEITTVRDPDGTGLYYTVRDMALGISYARQVSDRLRIGLTGKYIGLQAHNERAQTVAVDIGSILQTGFYGLKIGMALTNFGGNVKYDGRDLIEKSDTDDDIDGNVLTDVRLATESWPLPMMIRIGIAGEIIGSGMAPINSSSQRLTYALDATHPNDAPEQVNVGLEYALWERLFLRMGYRYNYDLEGLTFGAGLQLPIPALSSAAIDFAVSPMELFGNTTRTSVEIRF